MSVTTNPRQDDLDRLDAMAKPIFDEAERLRQRGHELDKEMNLSIATGVLSIIGYLVMAVISYRWNMRLIRKQVTKVLQQMADDESGDADMAFLGMVMLGILAIVLGAPILMVVGSILAWLAPGLVIIVIMGLFAAFVLRQTEGDG